MESLVKCLFTLLADVATFSLKSQNFHWNVTGNDFYQLHLLFERVYNTAVEDIDPIAEHTRGYGYRIPATQKSFINLSNIKELEVIPPSNEMVKILYNDAGIIINDLNVCAQEATTAKQQGTLNLITALLEKYQTIRYLLGSAANLI